MKKIIAILLMVVVCVSLVGCNYDPAVKKTVGENGEVRYYMEGDDIANMVEDEVKDMLGLESDDSE